MTTLTDLEIDALLEDKHDDAREKEFARKEPGFSPTRAMKSKPVGKTAAKTPARKAPVKTARRAQPTRKGGPSVVTKSEPMIQPGTLNTVEPSPHAMDSSRRPMKINQRVEIKPNGKPMHATFTGMEGSKLMFKADNGQTYSQSQRQILAAPGLVLANSDIKQPEKSAAPAPQTTTTASTRFMLTNAMREKLASLGYKPNQIKNLTPDQAQEIIDTNTVTTSGSGTATPSSPQGSATPDAGNAGGGSNPPENPDAGQEDGEPDPGHDEPTGFKDSVGIPIIGGMTGTVKKGNATEPVRIIGPVQGGGWLAYKLQRLGNGSAHRMISKSDIAASKDALLVDPNSAPNAETPPAATTTPPNAQQTPPGAQQAPPQSQAAPVSQTPPNATQSAPATPATPQADNVPQNVLSTIQRTYYVYHDTADQTTKIVSGFTVNGHFTPQETEVLKGKPMIDLLSKFGNPEGKKFAGQAKDRFGESRIPYTEIRGRKKLS